MNDSLKSAAKAALSTDDLSQKIDDLRADLMKLAATVTDDMSEGLEKAGKRIGKTGRDAHTSATNAVVGYPLTAVGIAALVGFLIGLFARKG